MDVMSLSSELDQRLSEPEIAAGFAFRLRTKLALLQTTTYIN